MGSRGKVLLEHDEVVELPRLQCFCHHHCPPGIPDSQPGICTVDWGGRCFAAVEEVMNPGTGQWILQQQTPRILIILDSSLYL
jgi:hypothetical protein